MSLDGESPTVGFFFLSGTSSVKETSCSFGRSFSFSPGAKFAAGGEEDCAVEPECAALCSARGASSSALATCSVDFTWKW